MQKRLWIQSAFIAAVVIIGLLYISMGNTTDTIVMAGDSSPIYEIPIEDSMQTYIGELCQEHDVSYELMLSIYVTENATTFVRETVKGDIIELANRRNFWKQKGYPDEIVYDMLLDFRWNTTKAENRFLVEDYAATVTEYKSYLEQRFDQTKWMGGK